MGPGTFAMPEVSILAAESWVKGKREETPPQATPAMYIQCFKPPQPQSSGVVERCYGFVEGRLLLRTVTYERAGSDAADLFEAVAAAQRLPAALFFSEPDRVTGCSVYAGDTKKGEGPSP